MIPDSIRHVKPNGTISAKPRSVPRRRNRKNRLCFKCGSSIEEGKTHCPFCGAEIEYIDPMVQSSEIDEEIVEIVIRQKTESIIDEEQDDEGLILHTPDIEEMDFLEEEEQVVTRTLDIIPERNYIYWALLGIISAGIIFLIYLFVNIEDLEKHSQYPNDSQAEKINVSASQTLMLFLVAIFCIDSAD